MNLTFFILGQPARSRLAAGAGKEGSVGDRFRLAAFVGELARRAFELGIRWMKYCALDGLVSVDRLGAFSADNIIEHFCRFCGIPEFLLTNC